ncbi:hypothetical protein SB912_25705, partial [Pantoea sp. SIMBA_072]
LAQFFCPFDVHDVPFPDTTLRMMRHRCDACAMQLKGQALGLEGDRLPQGTCGQAEESGCVMMAMPLLYAHTVNCNTNSKKGIEVMNGRRSGVPQQPRPGALVHG